MKNRKLQLTEQEWIDVANMCQDVSIGYGVELANKIRQQLLVYRSLEISMEPIR